ncbi:FAD-dependent oxidoreductase [Alkalibacter rhizosphaerae]|uniref:FAD-dependent oxidoreductase n=1 Tax=Alkalibacter rhizosphaerae TaxID=2815577 RepID=A0A974XDJ6_9FIRM|nr:FAD-dependent oxidoreductase [Alkalibacter rhizosphaerae]QSX07751.1 FAD-dependent oxidoreductase [Alkalibacter rhizosphaerae]
MKLVIVGGVAGGATAAGRYRRLDKDAEIIILDKGAYISFANCGLPYYVGGVIEEKEDLLASTPEAMKEEYNIDVRLYNEVTKVDPAEKRLSVTDHQTGETYEETYDKLILATGSSPLKPPIPGIDGENIFPLWTIPDAQAILAHMDKKEAKTAAIIGGGFIGIEMAENLHRQGLKVSIVEMSDQVMAPLDKEMAEYVHEELKKKDIELILGDGVDSFTDDKGKTQIATQSGRTLAADLVLLSIGVRPNSQLAKEAGLKVGERGGIVVSDRMETSDPGIYAVGDVIEVVDFVQKTKTMIPLAGPANKQGRIVANVIGGQDDHYSGTQGTSAVRIFDLDICATGVNEKMLIKQGKEKGKDFEIIKIDAANHAGYYPGTEALHIKVVFDLNDGRILGPKWWVDPAATSGSIFFPPSSATAAGSRT